ncbi:MAG: hypothetical protein Q2484_07590, partial [Candidatus Sedimenticola sp. (ex Thyasira tokunagai)]
SAAAAQARAKSSSVLTIFPLISKKNLKLLLQSGRYCKYMEQYNPWGRLLMLPTWVDRWSGFINGVQIRMVLYSL